MSKQLFCRGAMPEFVTIEIGNTFCRVLAERPIIRELNDVLSEAIEGAEYMGRYMPSWWDGRDRFLKKNGIFPDGLLPLAVGHLSERGIPFRLEDYRGDPPIPEFKKEAEFGVTPRYYQLDILNVTRKKEKGAIVAGTGSGKRLVAIMIVNDKKVSTLIIVPNLDLKSEMFRNCVECFGSRLVSDDVESDAPIIVANYQALAKVPDEAFRRFKMLICDEAHHLSCKSITRVAGLCINAYYKYGLTATYLRATGGQMALHAVISEVIYSKPAIELIEEGFLARPHIFMINMSLVGYPKTYAESYNQLVSDKTVNDKICELTRKVLGKQTLILVKRIDHGEVLEKMLAKEGAVFLNGSHNVDYRNGIKSLFNRGGVKILIASAILSEGTDIPSIDCLINARFEASTIQTKQGLGRALRIAPGKDKAIIFDFNFVGQQHLQKHSRERLLSYRSEKFDVKIV